MRKLPRLYLTMLRYRVAAMVALFMLLGAAREGRLEFGPRYLFAALALASSYVAATALNDLADEEIDKVNHPRDAGRPLVEGWATRRELFVLHVCASIVAVCAAIPLGVRGIGLLVAALAVSQLYSARPLRLSYRVAGAPIALGLAYVLVPYCLGIVVAEGRLHHSSSVLTLGLFLLFSARIMLKDFRDRAGDERYGKPTILLRYGKTATCSASLCALVAGDAFLVAALQPALVLFAQPFLFSIGWMLWRLWRAEDPVSEQVAIGIGARMGNGLLLCVLTWLTVEGRGATVAQASVLTVALSALFFFSFASLAAHPGEAVIGYKG
jgi:4-hydroxybenzoate polyprenyltransferase